MYHVKTRRVTLVMVRQQQPQQPLQQDGAQVDEMDDMMETHYTGKLVSPHQMAGTWTRTNGESGTWMLQTLISDGVDS